MTGTSHSRRLRNAVLFDELVEQAPPLPEIEPVAPAAREPALAGELHRMLAAGDAVDGALDRYLSGIGPDPGVRESPADADAATCRGAMMTAGEACSRFRVGRRRFPACYDALA